MGDKWAWRFNGDILFISGVMFRFGNRSVDRMEGVNDLLVKCAIKALSKSSYDMTIPWMGGVRTALEQKDLFDAGNSKADGFDKRSFHQSGNALDIIPVIGGYENIRVFNHFAKQMFSTWQLMIYLGEAKGLLYWGGHFGESGWDKPHWEVR